MGDFLLYAIGVPVTFLMLVTGLALGARRLLGLRVGLVRTALACLLGLVLSEAALSGMPDPETSPALAGVQFGIAVLILVALLTAAEVVAPTGTTPPPTEWWRALRGRSARARRYSRITAIAFRHGLGPYLRGRERTDTRLARSLRLALEEAGVTFVKLGQVLSTRPDLLPPDVVAELVRLQDRVPAAPWPRVREVLVAELGRPPEEVFAEFDEEPLAAASIAQVHRARLRSGAEVVVKVQRPDVRRVAEGDLDIVDRLAATLHDRTRWGRAIGVRDLAAGFSAALREELDFRVEARNLAAVRAASAGTDVVLPAVHEALSTARVLVMERLDGVPVREAAGTADRDALARSLLDALLRQVLVDGVFHADPHPGNVVVLRDGRLGLLDLGSVGRIDAQLRAALGKLLLAVDRGDPAGMRDALLELVARPDEIDEQLLERALGRFAARHLGAGARPDAEVFADLFRLVHRYGLGVPPEIAAVFRALGTVQGTLVALSPGFDLVAESRAFAEQRFSDHLTPGSLRREVIEELHAVLPVLRRLPRRLDRITGALEQGRLGVNLRLFADERDRRFVVSLLHQVMLTVLGATAGLMAVLLLGADGGPRVGPGLSLFQVFGYHLLLISVLLGLRVVVAVFRPRG